MTVNAAAPAKTVGDPNAEYESLVPLWRRCRAVCGGEKHVKDADEALDTLSFTNILLPFSPSMDRRQYAFYKAEAELPGIVSQFVKMLVGGLLRKQPVLSLPKDVPPDASNWLLNEFGQDGASLVSFLDGALYEELQTSRAWVFVDHPTVEDGQDTDARPYPVLVKAESVINWHTSKGFDGRDVLDFVIVKDYEETFVDGSFHPKFREIIRVHMLDENGFYEILEYEAESDSLTVPVVNGERTISNTKRTFKLRAVFDNILAHGKRLTVIPAWPLNGGVPASEPLITPLVDKEVALYNKVSRRNHLLYNAATFTPVLKTDMLDSDFQKIVNQGLGTWIRLRPGEEVDALATPTDALADYEKAIAAGIEEMARLGIRMLSPEAAQSGVALEIRNAAQNAQLGTLNTKVSNTLRQIMSFMLFWKYDIELPFSDIKLELSTDFNPMPLGADWLRLATEWYQLGLIPRSVWLQILKQNDILSPDYDDKAGLNEIANDKGTVPTGQPI